MWNAKMLLSTFLIALIVNIKSGAEGANILALMSVASPSHALWNTVLVNGLANRGHTITVLTANLPKSANDLYNPNVTYIHMEALYQSLLEYDGSIRDYIDTSPIMNVMGYAIFGAMNCNGTLQSKGLLQFMEEYKDAKFDLILNDYVLGPCLLGFVHKYNYPPLVSVSAFPYIPITAKFVGGHFYPSYVSYHSTLLDPKNNFIDRMSNTLYLLLDEFFQRYVMIPQMDDLVRKVFPADTPSVGELEKLSALAIVGSHPAITQAHPIPQNVIEVGGLNLIETQPLPKHLTDFMTAAKKGAIFFSLGTNVKPKDLGTEVAEKLLAVMEQFSDYHFMWKFDSSLITKKIPNNVLIQDFFPQRDILAHPKTKCFITHAGGLSTQESVWFGVPMITIPVIVDQIRNSYMAVKHGIAVELSFLALDGPSFGSALNEVLNNPKYVSNIELKSKRFRDRPMKPLDTAVWWIEYVLRDPNPDHLRVPTMEMGFFLANSYDFLALVLVLEGVSIYLFVKLVKCICCRRSKKGEVEKKLKKN